MSKGRMKPPKGWKPGRGPRGSEYLGRTTITDAAYPARRPEPSSSEPVETETLPVVRYSTPGSTSSTSDLAPAQPDKDGYIRMAEGGTITGAIENMGTELQEGIGFLDGILDAMYSPAWDIWPLSGLPGLGADSDPRR